MAVNPLMLQIIALVHRDRGTLPQRRVELYEECTNVLLERWDAAKGLKVSITAKEARELLQPLALWLHEVEGRRYAPMDDIVRVVRGPLEDMNKKGVGPEELIRNIRDRSGIFMGHSEKEYGFTHLSFQEYLAAERIRNETNIHLLVEKYGERWWREVILLSLSLANPSVIELFLQAIIPREEFKTDLTLIMDALKDSLIKPSEPFLQALANKELASETKANAIRLLRGMAGHRIIDTLRTVVSGRDKVISQAAYEALVALGATEGVARPISEFATMIVNPKDNAPMVLIPAGTFLYGSRDDDKEARSNEKPQRVVDLPAFYMDVYPVTNSQFAAFLNEQIQPEKKLERWINLKRWVEESDRIKLKKKVYEVKKGLESHPVIFVSWYGAQAYARWAGKRLPNEQEWEKAARGTDGRIYPWGDDFDKTLCNFAGIKLHNTSPVDLFSKGKGPYGCYDMAGNVWEWTSSFYDPKKNSYILRGGSWYHKYVFCRCAGRDFVVHPNGRGFDIGFRCAKS